jgi:hypothetical protein
MSGKMEDEKESKPVVKASADATDNKSDDDDSDDEEKLPDLAQLKEQVHNLLLLCIAPERLTAPV